ncbi:hypothetical protein BJ994_001016 [Arthrobacter pigmenti]|uniref:DUF4345 domain-containing protein n=1 Tax=Arthrobacter pigmenti TaxID=271432 RepID=A0A846RJU3_9MICC|nr:DUF4345 domain-containing protein [Arthrobacter pigmenti]NJC21940.1 hypothetical protein [Arthrobacter pigmenti]
MSGSTPENSPRDGRTTPTAAGERQSATGSPNPVASGGASARDRATSGKIDGLNEAGKPSNAGKPNHTGESNKRNKNVTGNTKTAKEGNDWSVFRTVVVLVGLVIAGFGTYYLITGTAGLPETGDGAVNPTLENQFRFFAAMMIGVGAAFVTIAIKFQWANMLWLVCLMVFIGGIGRVLSWAFSGTPHFLLIILMVVELAFPATLLVWHRYIAKTSEMRQEYAARS